MSPTEEGGTTLADVRRVVEVGLTAANGRLDVIIERLEQQDKRADQHAAQLATLDTRLDEVERAAVTREDMDARSRRTISIVALVVTGIGILVGTLTTVIITLTT
ncbi:hypothetical protein [Nocardiopsis sp. TNDT3]|uniref:hypothetical protein n=1 Tax=Nocardiopsis sp. TNDT3 TaxID=2249354 RepID=UPI000E3B92FE|nr:hypothetical protein [Nocardiopsis sp. TNDT3]